MSASKGHKPRPFSIPRAEFDSRYSDIDFSAHRKAKPVSRPITRNLYCAQSLKVGQQFEEPIGFLRDDGQLFVRQEDGKYVTWTEDPKLREPNCLQHRYVKEQLSDRTFTPIND